MKGGKNKHVRGNTLNVLIINMFWLKDYLIKAFASAKEHTLVNRETQSVLAKGIYKAERIILCG